MVAFFFNGYYQPDDLFLAASVPSKPLITHECRAQETGSLETVYFKKQPLAGSPGSLMSLFAPGPDCPSSANKNKMGGPWAAGCICIP